MTFRVKLKSSPYTDKLPRQIIIGTRNYSRFRFGVVPSLFAPVARDAIYSASPLSVFQVKEDSDGPDGSAATLPMVKVNCQGA